MAKLKRQMVINEMERGWQVRVPPELHSLGLKKLLVLQDYVRRVVDANVNEVWNEVMKRQGPGG